MKRLLLIFAASACVSLVRAQNMNGDASFFTFDRNAQPEEIHTLGSDPEFPYLRNLYTPHQVYEAMKRHENSDRLNGIMNSIGFSNGVKDVSESDITAANVPSGTSGNMGSGKAPNGYYKLTGTPAGYRAWKITSDNGSYVYLMAKCGNAFYPNANAGKTACINAAVNVTSEPKDVTVNSTPAAMLTDRTYVYYHEKRHRKNETAYTSPGLTDDNPSKPLLLNAVKKTEATPTTYRITVSGPTDKVTVCTDSATNIPANIDVEQSSSYTGNYPNQNPEYKEVSRGEYRRAERKMKHVEKKEAKVSRITGVPVNIEKETSDRMATNENGTE